MIVDAMHAYFLPVRFYSRYYPYMGFRSAMVHIALERTRQVRCLRLRAWSDMRCTYLAVAWVILLLEVYSLFQQEQACRAGFVVRIEQVKGTIDEFTFNSHSSC